MQMANQIPKTLWWVSTLHHGLCNCKSHQNLSGNRALHLVPYEYYNDPRSLAPHLIFLCPFSATGLNCSLWILETINTH
ncbi:hypothetical protein FF011L_33990 [Roseimaritima multifibrata]|uniref:Uncharacterized protein n=1 Tax=Roseimaritima multifibrata TaxID=1930274 RepID=A0A517MIA5_9BACT|nr:hypothetical protein FF011L_33990 [Roseimaritima multifibrata]